MTGKTHLLAGAFTALACHCTGAEVVMVCFGALLPDIDQAQSTVGQKAPLLGRILTHRGPTHSLLMLAAATFVNPWLGVGVLTHLLLDMMTAKGVLLLWPWHKKCRLPLAKYNKTRGKWEKVLQYALLAGTVLLCIASTDRFFDAPGIIQNLTAGFESIKQCLHNILTMLFK